MGAPKKPKTLKTSMHATQAYFGDWQNNNIDKMAFDKMTV